MQESSDIILTSGLLTIPQVAAYLGVCRAHVYKLIHQGLPIIRLGRRVMVSQTSLQRWLEEQEHVSRSS